jgi:hypothetical protein
LSKLTLAFSELKFAVKADAAILRTICALTVSPVESLSVFSPLGINPSIAITAKLTIPNATTTSTRLNPANLKDSPQAEIAGRFLAGFG